MICGLCDKAKVTELLCKLPSRYGNHVVNGQWVVDTKNRDQIDMIGFFELTNRHGEWCCAYVDEDHCILTFADGEKACSFAWTIENALEELLEIINRHQFGKVTEKDKTPEDAQYLNYETIKHIKERNKILDELSNELTQELKEENTGFDNAILNGILINKINNMKELTYIPEDLSEKAYGVKVKYINIDKD